MPQKEENRLMKKWINNLKEQVSNRQQKIKIIRIAGHQDPYQERGISDYLICYQGKFIAIEFKTEGGKLSDYQGEFLRDIHFSGGIVLVIVVYDKGFMWRDISTTSFCEYEWGQEMTLLNYFA